MSKGINKVILIGNCGQDPDTKYSASGAAITNISIATSESWKDKQTGQQQERTEWHRVVFYNRLAEIAGEYLRKGSKVYVEGSLQTRKWQDQNGQDRYTTEIVANEMQMLDSRQEAPPQQQGNPPMQSQPPQQGMRQQSSAQAYLNAQQGAGMGGQQAQPQQAPQAAPPAMEKIDDNIPF